MKDRWHNLPRLAVDGSQKHAWTTMFILFSLMVGIVFIGVGLESLITH
jgi:hypothetical protein